jgi:hypothetical protein
MPLLELRDDVVGEFPVSGRSFVEPTPGRGKGCQDWLRGIATDRRRQGRDRRLQARDAVFLNGINERQFQPDLLKKFHNLFGGGGLVSGHMPDGVFAVQLGNQLGRCQCGRANAC